MKKFLSLILIICYCLTLNMSFAFSELNYLKNAKKEVLIPQVETLFITNNYEIKQKDSTYSAYAISTKDSEKYATIVLQQSGENLFYYFDSDKSSKKLNRIFKRNLKKQDIDFEKSTNEMHLNNFSKIVQKIMTGKNTEYTFEATSKGIFDTKPTKAENTSALKGYVGKIPKGSIIEAYLQTAINTATAQQGEQIVAILKSDWVYNNTIIAPQGSIVYGALIEAESARYGSRNGYVKINFNQLVTPNGKTYNITTERIDFNVTNEGKFKKSITKVAGTAVAGALIGLVFGALTGDSDNMLKGASIGAGLAGGTVLASSIAERGIDAEIPSYTDMEIILEEPLSVILNY